MGWRHGDDMVFIGERSIVNRTWDVLSKNLLMKKRAVLGFGPGDDKHISLLNRLITLEFAGGKRRITLEPDPRHVDLIIKGMGLRPGRSKGVSTRPSCGKPGIAEIRPSGRTRNLQPPCASPWYLTRPVLFSGQRPKRGSTSQVDSPRVYACSM